MILDRRLMLVAGVALPCCAAAGADIRVFTPEEFGARGDGRSNDGPAFARLSAAVNAHGGGTIRFRRATYMVGGQVLALEGRSLYRSDQLIRLLGCRRALRLIGNGARIKCLPGLRYGVFDARGRPRETAMPYLGDGLASPYRAMISIENCTAEIEISDLTVEGPGDEIVLGGQWGDVGWQVPAIGISLHNNRGPETLTRIRAFGHPQDGLMLDGTDEAIPGVLRILTDVEARDNGRQACSIIGGRGYRFIRCSFTRSGRGRVGSPPGAGADIEAESGKRVRDLEFVDCRFADNIGVGMVADSGDSEDARFLRCTFVGTTSWSAWPNKPRFRFADSTFVGALVRTFSADDPARAAQFLRCTFTDDPKLSPTGEVYGGVNPTRPLADLSDARNILFDRCRFLARHGGVLPWSTEAIYRDCVMVQGTNNAGFPRGRFEGTNRITGSVDLYGSRFEGPTFVNGQRVGQ